MIDFFKKYYLAISNFILFSIVVILFISIFTLKNAPSMLRTVYGAMTIIYAIITIITVIFKYFQTSTIPVGGVAPPADLSLTYIVAFIINAVLCMVALYYTRHIKMLEALVFIFFIFICFALFKLESISSDINTYGTSFNVNSSTIDWFKIKSWQDYVEKTSQFFNLGFNWVDASNFILQAGWLIFGIIKLPFFILMNAGWAISSIMQLMSWGFSKVPTPAPSTTSAPPASASMLSENVRKTLTYGLYLILFMAGLFFMHTFEDKMRKHPLKWLFIAGVASFAFLAWIRFFNATSFEKYFLFALIGLFMVGIYLYNPYNILDSLAGLNMFAIFMIFLFLLTMIFIYAFLPETNAIAQMISSYFGKMIIGLVGLIISVIVIMFLVASIGKMHDKSPTVGMYILNTLIVIGMLTIVFNMLDQNRTIRDNPYFKLILSILFYIPCLVSDLADLVMSEYYKTKYFTLIIIVLEIVFAIVYWLLYPEVISKAYSGGGKVLVSEPTSLNVEKTVAYYRNLSGDTTLDYKEKGDANAMAFKKSLSDSSTSAVYNAVSGEPMLDLSGNPLKDLSGNYYFPTKVNTYRFGISCWLYINPMPSAGDSQLTILNYGDNPNISYNPKKNELSVYMQNNTDECNSISTIPVFTLENTPLQKWINIVLNYDGGRLDVFLNAELVKTSFDVISCIRYDALTIGQTNGVNAKMCNLTYFNKPLDIITIHTMFNLTKIEDIPSVPKKDLFSVNL